MSEFGFFWDIYGQDNYISGKSESKINYEDSKKIDRLEHFLKSCKTANEIENVYNKFLETCEESDKSKELLKDHMNRVIKK